VDGGIRRRCSRPSRTKPRARGWTTLRLETGPRQPEAIALYVGAGYREVASFGAYTDSAEAGDSLFFERVLAG
jgi:hypothetical protein